jgi:hypothetical protein
VLPCPAKKGSHDVEQRIQDVRNPKQRSLEQEARAIRSVRSASANESVVPVLPPMRMMPGYMRLLMTRSAAV